MSDSTGRGHGSKVGYKRPPVQHQFKKGRSGNPAGRPRKAQAQRTSSTATTELDGILLTEAMRPVKVREDDQVVEIPMMQAVVRSLGFAAIKGDRRSQLALAGMVKTVQQQKFENLKQLFADAAEYKVRAQEIFDECDRRGEPRPDIVPHPDEIILDTRDMEVRINGPEDEHHKAQWDEQLARRQTALAEIEDLKKRAARSKKHRKFYEDDIAHEQWLADLIGSLFPDEKTRRAPGFNLGEWRERQGKLRDIREQWRKGK
jgi:hypothetical protein